MMNTDKTAFILLEHFKKYPKLQAEDIFKFLHHSVFGCEHLVSSPMSAANYIEKEAIASEGFLKNDIEELDGDFVRLHLGYLKNGISANTLSKLFFLSSQKEKGEAALLEEKLNVAERIISDGVLPLDLSSFSKAALKWKRDGYPALHHSSVFRSEYHPAYRVISNEYVPFLPLFSQLDKLLENGNVMLALEGGSASGKSTLGALLEYIYDCALFHMDDFFLQPHQRTAERFNEPGGNVDRERFLAEVLIPLSDGKTVKYRPFNCSKMALDKEITAEKKALTVIEGAYSMHPELRAYYDLSVFLDISSDLQKKRIEKRNSEKMAQRFFNEWIPMEKKYFHTFDIKNKCNMVIEI